MSGISQFVINRGLPTTLSSHARTYCGTMYAVRFRVNTPIILTKIGFFGPCMDGLSVGSALLPSSSQESRGPMLTLFAKLEIVQSMYHDLQVPSEELEVFERLRMFELQIPTDGPRGKVFVLTLPREVRIPSGILVDIKFELFGRHQEVRFFRLPDNHPAYVCETHDQSGVEWTFLNSSKQLSTMYYKVETNGSIADQISMNAEATPAYNDPERASYLSGSTYYGSASANSDQLAILDGQSDEEITSANLHGISVNPSITGNPFAAASLANCPPMQKTFEAVNIYQFEPIYSEILENPNSNIPNSNARSLSTCKIL